MNTDDEWEKWGAQEPYFGVLTNPKFRSAAITQAARDEFFHSGQIHASYILNTCIHRLNPAFVPQAVLDFGCGVGRVVIPFASAAQRVMGVDVSQSMLTEARRNCELRGLLNVELVRSDDALSAVTGQFDLVHSCIVLQHIEVARGRQLFKHLIGKVRPGGIGALHVTFGWDAHAANFGQPVSPPTADPAQHEQGAFAQAKSHIRRVLEPLGMGRPPQIAAEVVVTFDPEMQMNYYNLSELMFILQQAGVTQVFTDITDHGGALGAFLFFRSAPAV